MQLSASSETSRVDSLKSPELKKEVNPNAAVIINYESFKPMCVADLLAAHDEKITNSTLISNYDSFRPQSVEALLAAHEQKATSAAATTGSIPEEVDASAVLNSNFEPFKPQSVDALLAAHDEKVADNV
jgi:hypothetical protein